MSDHEGDTFDGWKEATLPSQQSLSSPAKDSRSHIRSSDAPQQSIARPQAKHDNKAKADLPCTNHHTHHRSSANTPEILGITGREGGIQSRRAQALADAPSSIKNAASDKYRQGVKPEGWFELSAPWKNLLSKLATEKTPAAYVARDRLDEICQISGVYIASPELDATKIALWGDEEQVMQAKDLLGAFCKQIRAQRMRSNKPSWDTPSAFDARAVDRKEREAHAKALNTAVRSAADLIDYGFEAYLLLPESFSASDFIRAYDGVLNGIRDQFGCKIEIPQDPATFIHMGAHEEDDVLAVYLRVQNLVAESMSYKDVTRLNTIVLPSAPEYFDRVFVVQDHHTKLWLPKLNGRAILASQEDQWHVECRRMRHRSRRAIRNAIDDCIKAMKAPEKHVAMRVAFGMLGFSLFQLPGDNEDSFGIAEFVEMVGNPMTRLQLCDLANVQNYMSELFDKLMASDVVTYLNPLYTLQFDFKGSLATTVRYEIVFKPGTYDTTELEKLESRWLQLQDGDEATFLEINMLEFGRLGSQLQIVRNQLLISDATKRRMDFWENKIGFDPPKEGIKAYPRRRAVYSASKQEFPLVQVSEMIAERFQFRDTEGIFELRRQDVYDERPTKKKAVPNDSSWSVIYSYPEWASLLRQFGPLRPGQEVDWKRSVQTFFPPGQSKEDYGALPKGFRAFLKEVEDIRGLLNDAMGNQSMFDEDTGSIQID